MMQGAKYSYRFIAFYCVFFISVWISGVDADLINRGGGMIYDTDLDITWLQDVTYAVTSGYDNDGLMSWTDAVAWADQLSFGGYDDWRLPHGLPEDGTYIEPMRYDGSTDWGFNITENTATRNEMAYLFYEELGNMAKYNKDGTVRAEGTYGLENTGPFINLTGDLDEFWTGTEISNNRAIRFSFNDDDGDGERCGFKGRQYYDGPRSENLNAWAVRDGDVAMVPEPPVIFLLLSGIGFICFVTAYRKRAGASPRKNVL